jgi:Zn-dependent protease
MDRARLVSGYRDSEPLRRGGTDWRGGIRKAIGPLIAVAIALAKWTFVLVKFGSIFIAVGGYALIWGWSFAVGFVALILLHELGHYIEAKREGLNPQLPIFIPFLLAYVRYTRGNPWQTARVALAGPILGGLASLAFAVAGQADGSQLLQALAFTGFFLNLANMIPIAMLDGGAIWRSAAWLRRGGGGGKATAIYALYFGTAALLALGMFVTYVEQHRL